MRALLALTFALICVTASGQTRSLRRVVREAVSEFDRGNFAEARALFLEAYEIEPSARLMRGAGMASFEERDYAQAHRQFQAALAEERNALTNRQRREVEELFTRTQTFLGRFHVELDPADAELTIDLRAPELEEDGAILLDIGEHSMTVTAEGHLPLDRRLNVTGGEEETLRLTLEPEPPPAPEGPRERSVDGLGWALIAGGSALLAGAVAALGWWIERFGEVSSCQDATRDPGRRCLNVDTLRSQRRGAGTVTMVLTLTGAFALTAGIVRWTWSDDRPVAVACGGERRGGACSLRLSF